MGPRSGFVVSLLAACGIHAVLLLVPRAPVVEETPVPTVELDLSAAPAPSPALAEATPAVTRKIEAAVAATTRSIVPQETQALSSPPEPASNAPTTAPDGQGLQAASADESTNSTAAPAALSSEGGAGTAPAVPAVAAVSAPVLIPPTPRAEILPSYPRSARRSGLEGVVKVTAMVDASGAVTSAEVLVSSGHAALDQAALEAVRRALFAPAMSEGVPVPCRIVIPIRFQLSASARN
jgi:protein TonB